MKKITEKFTYSNVMATIAVFLVLGGGAAVAAGGLGKNTVGAKQLKKGAVTTAKIKNGAVTGSKIALSSLGAVPSATHASSADSAANAQALQGLTPAQLGAASTLRCPAGTILSAGLCFEPSLRPSANYLEALEICADGGRILPSVADLTTFGRHNLSGPLLFEWAGQYFYDGTTFRAPEVSSTETSLTTGIPAIASTIPFRCAVPPSN